MEERDRLLAAIADDPDALENWVVYADWLSERDDPRGELINLELAIEDGAKDDALVERRNRLANDEDALVGDRLRAEVHHCELDWWRGFIRGAAVFGPDDDPPTGETLAALFADPHACVLERLNLSQDPSTMAGTCCPSLRQLELVRSDDLELPLAATFPRLARLYFSHEVHEGEMGTLEHLAHPTLRAIWGYCPALASGDFELPVLERLEVAFVPVDELFAPQALLMQPPASLHDLSTWVNTSIVPALRVSPVLCQLRTLTLNCHRAEVDAFAIDPAPFRHLALRCLGSVDTAEERDELRARLTEMFPTATIDITAMGEHAPPEPPKSTVDLAPVGELFSRLADRLRRKNSEDA